MSIAIDVLDLASGAASHRPTSTLTLDVPRDLPESAVVFVDDGRRGRYVANNGKGVDYGVLPRPLGWRRPGEICLVARSGGASRGQCESWRSGAGVTCSGSRIVAHAISPPANASAAGRSSIGRHRHRASAAARASGQRS